MSRKWQIRLSELFGWESEEPGPEVVVTEAKQQGVESLENLIQAMQDAPSRYRTGYQKWNWCQEDDDALTG